MNRPEEKIPNLSEIRDEHDALDQSIALNRIVMALLQHQKDSNKRLFIALVLSLLINVATVAGFLWYESQWEYTTTETITTEQQVEGDNTEINNVQGNQYKDNATHNEGGLE